jgi:hypothetical protein
MSNCVLLVTFSLRTISHFVFVLSVSKFLKSPSENIGSHRLNIVTNLSLFTLSIFTLYSTCSLYPLRQVSLLSEVRRLRWSGFEWLHTLISNLRPRTCFSIKSRDFSVVFNLRAVPQLWRLVGGISLPMWRCRFRSHMRICDGQSGMGTGFSEYISFPLSVLFTHAVNVSY